MVADILALVRHGIGIEQLKREKQAHIFRAHSGDKGVCCNAMECTMYQPNERDHEPR